MNILRGELKKLSGAIRLLNCNKSKPTTLQSFQNPKPVNIAGILD